VGPTAIAFVNGDVSAVAKALRDFAKATPTLVVKGGVLDGKALSLKDLTALADLPSRDVLLARFAGLLASPMTTMAGLLKAIPQNFAYGLSALIDSKGGAPAPEASAPKRSPRLRPGSRKLARQRATTTRHPSRRSRRKPPWPSPRRKPPWPTKPPRRRPTSRKNRPNNQTK
jgi:hypothetical protein